MERFVIKYDLNGQKTDLYIEQMDGNNSRYSIERNTQNDRMLYDNKPLLLERGDHGTWQLLTKDNWDLNDEQINEIGQAIDAHKPGDSEFNIGVYSK